MTIINSLDDEFAMPNLQIDAIRQTHVKNAWIIEKLLLKLKTCDEIMTNMSKLNNQDRDHQVTMP